MTPGVLDLLDAINALGSRTNCWACALSVDATLSGMPCCAVSSLGVVVGDSALAPQLQPVADLAALAADIRASGAGARAVVCAFSLDGGTGHALNVVNHEGDAVFVDGQLGVAHTVESPFWQAFPVVLAARTS